LQAVSDLEALAEDEVSYLREQGREAEADRRADAWNREIARALGEAEALRQAVADTPKASPSQRRPLKIDQIQRLSKGSPSRALAVTAFGLVATVAQAWVIEKLTPELLAAAAIAGALSMLCRAKRSSRKRSRHGR
jgi:hypothetical protein